MTAASRMVGRMLRLPPAVTRDVTLTRDIDVIARDGTTLRTDHYAPRLDKAATILIRTPYGRKGVIGLVTGRVLAERGFHVVLQSCRGTFDSGGDFVPMRHEHDDGLDAVAWIEAQDWFDGNLFTYGPSYVGFTQWAIAADAGPVLKGMCTTVTAASFREPTYSGGSFSLDTVVNWATLLHNQGSSMLAFLYKQVRSQSRVRRAFAHVPLLEADTVATGREVAFVREWLAASADEPYWEARGHIAAVAQTTAPVCMIGGWYDIFLPWQLADYERQRAAGKNPRLVIGAWSHASRELFAHSVREGLAWFRAQLDGGTDDDPEPVRLYVGGAEEWRRFAQWPPSGRTREWSVASGGALVDGATATTADAFRYDPNDPTPSPGGALLTPEAGRKDNRAVEARADVLVYSTAALDSPVEVVGPVSSTVRVRSSSAHFDIFVRVCDVAPDGRSENICDGLIRVDETHPVDADGVREVEVAMWPAAYRWRPGHRIRVQIAGGAHPRYARNTGSGEPMGSATTMKPVDHEVLGAVLRMHSPE